MTFYTIGYGGRAPGEFLDLLSEHGIQTLVDVRLRPDRSAMGSYSRARSADKGIEKLLAGRGIAYRPIVELGNPFLELEDWQTPYRELIARAGDLLTARLQDLPEPFCLLCAEKRAADCHRTIIAEHLVRTRGWTVRHLE